MAVLIKGMEMPKACVSCRFLDDNGDYNVCCATSESVGYTFPTREKRMPHCPLAEAKEPKPYESHAKLPCPKCGTPRPEMIIIAGAGKTYAGIRCRECQHSRYGNTEIEAIRAWNAEKREG